jgi:hypothetical protein
MILKKLKVKKAQQEMVGFALILIILAVVFMVFLSFSLRSSNDQTFESYEATSFLSSVLEYTTDCAIYYETDYASIQELIKKCSTDFECFNGNNSCKVLNQTISEILENSWNVGSEYPEKGYSFNITEQNSELLSFSKGNITRNFKSAHQELVGFEVSFRIYV